MEDRHAFHIKPVAFPDMVCAGVFDGHGGSDVASDLQTSAPSLLIPLTQNLKDTSHAQQAAWSTAACQYMDARYTEYTAQGSTMSVVSVNASDGVGLAMSVGDSPIFQIRDGGLRRVTLPHGVPGGKHCSTSSKTEEKWMDRHASHVASRISFSDGIVVQGRIFDKDGASSCGLNLSHAFGDYMDKQTPGRPALAQRIVPTPTVRPISFDKGDHVWIASDGVETPGINDVSADTLKHMTALLSAVTSKSSKNDAELYMEKMQLLLANCVPASEDNVTIILMMRRTTRGPEEPIYRRRIHMTEVGGKELRGTPVPIIADATSWLSTHELNSSGPGTLLDRLHQAWRARYSADERKVDGGEDDSKGSTSIQSVHISALSPKYTDKQLHFKSLSARYEYAFEAHDGSLHLR